MPAGVECESVVFRAEDEPSEPGPVTLDEGDSPISGPIY